jgi:hypothetical protein
MENHVNLVIATPGHSVMAPYLKSLLMTIDELNRRQISWLYTSEYSSHVADAREITLNGSNTPNPKDSRPFSGQVTYDKILWIDSDIKFTPEDVIKAYESEYDVVAGAYLLGNGTVVAHKEKMGQPYTYDEVLQMKEPVQVWGAGMGFMAVKSGVFESLSRPWFQSPKIEVDWDGGKLDFSITGEDLSFCHRAGEAGFEIWFDPSIKLEHNKVMKLTWEGPRS